MAKTNYKVGEKLNFIGGVKIQITSVNSDGTANFSELNPSTKKPYPFTKGLHGKLPSLAQQSEEKIKLTSFAGDEVEEDGNVSPEAYAKYGEIADDTSVHLDLTNNVDNKYDFINLSGFKKFLQGNVGKVQFKLVEAPPTIIHGNLGDTVLEHRALGKTRTLDKVSSSGFELDGSLVNWGKAHEWSFRGNMVIWSDSGDDSHYLVYEIV